MSGITIRVATPDDLEMLSELIAASYAMPDNGAYEPERLAATLPIMSRANPKLLVSGTYFVAEADGEPAACGGWAREEPGTGEIAEGVTHIRHFATHPAHLRKGIARLLLDRCLSEAAASGAHVMKSQSTLMAEKFYASAGFRRIRLMEAEMAPGVSLPVVEMARDLP
jgi:GNAT superfamily N-acetyltransferase